MARILITGSSDGLGQAAALKLIKNGHKVTLHARNEHRAKEALNAAPGADGVLVGDLGSIAQTRKVAAQANEKGVFDVVMHNAGLGPRRPYNETDDGISEVFAVNVLAPYILTSLMPKPKRLIYLSSGMHNGAIPEIDDFTWKRRKWEAGRAYSESKLLDNALAFAVARYWPDVESNASSPGWVSTKMGGPSATIGVDQGAETQVFLADSTEAIGSGHYWANVKTQDSDPAAQDPAFQDTLLKVCEELSGIAFPRSGGA